MNLGINGFKYADLYDHARLQDLAGAFDRFVEQREPDLQKRFASYRIGVQSGIATGGLTTPEESALLIAVGRELGVFLAQLFGTEAGVGSLLNRAQRDAQVAKFKKEFVTKRVAKVQAVANDQERIAQLDRAAEELIRAIHGVTDGDPEYALAVTALRLLELERDYPRGVALAPSAEARAALTQIHEQLHQAVERVESPEGVARE